MAIQAADNYESLQSNVVAKRLADIEKRIAQAKELLAQTDKASVAAPRKQLLIPLAIKLGPWGQIIDIPQITALQQAPIVPYFRSSG